MVTVFHFGEFAFGQRVGNGLLVGRLVNNPMESRRDSIGMREHMAAIQARKPELRDPAGANQQQNRQIENIRRRVWNNPVHHFNACNRRATSSALARLLKALMRK